MGSQEGVLPQDVWSEDELLALYRSVVMDNTPPARMREGMWIEETLGVAPSQPQGEQVLACAQHNEGSMATLRYQGARNVSFWVAHKALASLEDNVLKDWAATINLGPGVKALQLELLSVKVVLESTLGKVIHNSALEHCLMMLQDLVYEAEDVVDEMEYFHIQDMLDVGQLAEGFAHNLDINVSPCSPQSYFHDDDTYNDDDDDNGGDDEEENNENYNYDDDNNSPKLLSVHDEPPKLRFDRDNALRRIEHIVEQMQFMLQKVYNSIKLLGSDWRIAPNIAQSRPITISESTEPKLYGRELIMKSIIDDITKGKHSREVLTVIPIVGQAGIGKTTLAQHIYHSGEVQEHFHVRVWTCVSLNFNVNKLTKEIQRFIPEVDGESKNSTTGELIGQRLKSKRLLLVLDDIWDCSDEDEWNQLLVPFRKSQVQGNIIIITTRFPAQAHIMVQKKDHSIYLQSIENKEFEELFLEIIFGDDDQSRKDHEFLLETGIMIAGKLKGSPLAAKTVGRLLKTELDLVYWTRILESKEWEHCDGKNDIMPALKLSFDHLPCQLQQCFSYFALFPQDYEYKREDLINFWIGQEVLHYSSHGGNKRVEDTGLSHLSGLINYGFLEKKVNKDGRTCYIVHDLLHDLARKVSSLECLNIDSSQYQMSSSKFIPSIRHLSIKIDCTIANGRLTPNFAEDFHTLHTRLKVEKLRTLMIFGEDHLFQAFGEFGEDHLFYVEAFGELFREAKALRLVFLSGASYDVQDLLPNFYHLIHLRYLRIEGSFLCEPIFPNKVSRFYHMMVLDAKDCGIIDHILPRDICNLIKLRHLLVQNDEVHSNIIEVGKLKALQELRRFVVKQEAQGFELRQIGHLIDLCGLLSIYDLQNVQVKEEADEARLSSKGRLNELILHWGNIDRSANDTKLEEQVLERLMPNSNLLKLSVKGHKGATCPSWLGTNLSIKSLESLCLDGVAWEIIPPIYNVPREQLSGSIPKQGFQNMRKLELYNLSMVQKWVVNSPCQMFPLLEVLIIEGCPLLVKVSFQHIDVYQKGKEANANLFPRLKELKINNCPQLLSFPPIPWSKAPSSINIEGTGSSCHVRLVSEKERFLSWNKENRVQKEDNHEYSLTIEGKKYLTHSKYWNVLDFHNLIGVGVKELSLNNCESLPLRYIQMLSSLKILHMFCSSNTFLFVEADTHANYQFLVEKLCINKWNASGKELTQLLTYFPKLLDLLLKNCKNITGLAVNVKGQRATETPLYSANHMLLLPPQLQKLEINYFPELSLLCSNPHDASNEDGRGGGRGGLRGTSLRRLKISNCPKLITIHCPDLSLHSDPRDNSNQDGRTAGGGGLQGLTSLQRLEIQNCPNLVSSYSSSFFFPSLHFPNSLEHLYFDKVGTKVLPLSNLTSLTSLSLDHCGDLRGEGLLYLLAQGHLTKLSVINTSKLFVDSEPPWVHEQEHPSSRYSTLQDLQIVGEVAGFTAAPIRHSLLFSSLTKLKISEDVKLRSFTEDQEALLFVNSLEDITISWLLNLQFLPKRLHTLTNLKRLHINRCLEIQMLPRLGLLSSLEELGLFSCPNILSLPKDRLPDSLQILVIKYCRAIWWLPKVDDLPSSLRELDVHYSDSKELKRHCRKLINIIPIVKA